MKSLEIIVCGQSSETFNSITCWTDRYQTCWRLCDRSFFHSVDSL